MKGKEEIRSLAIDRCLLCGTKGEMIYSHLRDSLFNAPGEWNIRKCPSGECGLAWLDPMPLEDDIILAYQNYYTHQGEQPRKPPSVGRKISAFFDNSYITRKWNHSAAGMSPLRSVAGICRIFNPLRAAALDFRMMHLSPMSGGKLLEVGSGSGHSLKVLQEMGWIVEGVDFDGKAVENARKKGLSVQQGTLEGQHYPDDHFDAVTMSHVIEHVHDPVGLIQECRRILKPGGKLVLVTPNLLSLWHRVFGSSWRGLEPPRHLYLFSPQAISSLAGRAGFQKRRAFTTIRDSNNMFLASREISRLSMKGNSFKRTFFWKKIAKAAALTELGYRGFAPFSGTELVLVAEKDD